MTTSTKEKKNLCTLKYAIAQVKSSSSFTSLHIIILAIGLMQRKMIESGSLKVSNKVLKIKHHHWYLPKENENTHLKICMHPYVYHSTVYNSQNMEAT